MAKFNLQYDPNKTKDYLFALNEELKYIFGHLEEDENFADDISMMYARKSDKYSIVEQNAEKILWIVGSGEDESSFTLTPEAVTLASKEIKIDGVVTFKDLKENGKTVINGNNIKTGTVSADRITAGTIEGSTVSGITVNGAEITAGTITSGTLNGGTITGTTFNGGVIDIGETLYMDGDQIGLGDLTFSLDGTFQFRNMDGTFYCKEGVATCYRVFSTYNMQIYSDARLKENIKQIESAGEFLDKLNPVTFVIGGEKGIGFIAQEVEEINTGFPLVGSYKEWKALYYSSFIPIIVSAVKELQDEIQCKI